METQTRTIECAETAQRVPIYTVYSMLGINPTQPGAADSIRKASLKMLGFLQRSPAYAAALVKAGRAAEKYEHLQKA